MVVHLYIFSSIQAAYSDFARDLNILPPPRVMLLTIEGRDSSMDIFKRLQKRGGKKSKNIYWFIQNQQTQNKQTNKKSLTRFVCLFSTGYSR